jgi:predicted hydrocarbon binding protein
MLAEGNIKGIHIINVIEFVRKKRGKNGLDALFQRINKGKPKPQHVFENSFVEKEWYPYDLYLEFLSTADDVTGTGDMARCFEMGYQTIKNLGHLSYLARSPNVHDFLKGAQESWHHVYDFGSVESIVDEENKLVVRYHGFPKSKVKCEYFKGSLTGMLELCGLKGEVKETACNTEGAAWCEYTLTWK